MLIARKPCLIDSRHHWKGSEVFQQIMKGVQLGTVTFSTFSVCFSSKVKKITYQSKNYFQPEGLMLALSTPNWPQHFFDNKQSNSSFNVVNIFFYTLQCMTNIYCVSSNLSQLCEEFLKVNLRRQN